MIDLSAYSKRKTKQPQQCIATSISVLKLQGEENNTSYRFIVIGPTNWDVSF